MNVFEQTNVETLATPAAPVETAETTAPASADAAEATAPALAEAAPAEAEAATPASTEVIEISNVYKCVGEDSKRDKTAFEVVLMKTSAQSRQADVYYEDSKTVKKVNATVEQIGDHLPDGGVVVSISNQGQQRRVYATLRLTVDQLDLTGLSWEPRHKARRKGGEA